MVNPFYGALKAEKTESGTIMHIQLSIDLYFFSSVR